MPVPYVDVSTNSDDSCFCCCDSKGVSVYDSYPIQMRLDLKFDDAGISKCFLLNRTNYIAMVRNNSRVNSGGGDGSSSSSGGDGAGAGKEVDLCSPNLLNQVFIWDDLLKKTIFKLTFLYPIDKIFLTRLYLVIVSFKEIQLFTFTNPPRRLFNSHILKTDNSYTNDNIDFRLLKSIGLLAYESANRLGQIYISRLDYESRICGNGGGGINSDNYIPTNIIKAHKNPIRLIKLSPHGKYVATCSTRGTMVRVFNTVNGLLLNEYRRGLDSAIIYNMKFSQDDRFLCVVSNKQTLHIFQIDDGLGQQRNNKDSKCNHVKRSVCSIKIFNPLIRDSKEPFQSTDRCEILWNEYRDDKGGRRDKVRRYGIILVWYKYRIWIRYIVTHNEVSSKPFEIIKESWRQL